MIGVIALLARPGFLPEVVANFERQTHRDRLLVVVENGSGTGACARAGLRGVHVVQTEADRSIARNAGLRHLRALGVDHWALVEDDDLYGPEYLAEHWANRHAADVLGKACHVLRGPDGSRWRLHGGWQWKPIQLAGGSLLGGLAAATLFGSTAAALPWPTGYPWGEELEWYEAMLGAGRTLYSTSSEHFVRRRFEDTRHAHATPGSWRDEVTGSHAVELGPDTMPAWERALWREP
jgi:glycosyltransferase involved in cell wall biosynthesis